MATGNMTQIVSVRNTHEITPTMNVLIDDNLSDRSYNQSQPDETLSEPSTKKESSRKRKRLYVDTDQEDDTGDDKSVKTADENKKQNHSEIEKRRRNKMNTYITELSSMLPMCNAMSRKLDKLTVLRMAVQHLKTIRGAVNSYTEGSYKPTFLSDQELKMLILQAAEGFLFVVGCDRGRILYVSESVSEILNYKQCDLLGQSWFDILHPKDVAKVKEQLSSSDLSPRERLIDVKTMLPVKTDLPQGLSKLCPGARRSFFCRMKSKVRASSPVKNDLIDGNGTNTNRRKPKVGSDKKYCVIQCTGYLKSWAPAKVNLAEHENEGDNDSCNLSCLVAVGRILPNLITTINNAPRPVNEHNLRQIQFLSRHAMDGKFLFVDQRATLVLGFLPQELLGTSMYEYYNPEDIPILAETHRITLQNTKNIMTPVYRFRTKDNGFIKLQSEWRSFKNPWTKDLEYVIAKHLVILNDSNKNVSTYPTETNLSENLDFFTQTNGLEIQKIINSHVEASKIGRQIASQVLDCQRRPSDSSIGNSPDPEDINSNLGQSMSSGESNAEIDLDLQQHFPIINSSLPNFDNVRNDFPLNVKTVDGSESVVQDESPNQDEANDGNDEAAMAVIMSLLEADAGLGGPVDFTGLPWPLP